MVSSFIRRGVSPGKLSIGIDFYGVMWGAGAGTTTGGVTSRGRAGRTVRGCRAAPRTTRSVAATSRPPYVYYWDDAAEART